MPDFRPGVVVALLLLALCPAAAPAAVRADRNHDKIFDSLGMSGTAARPVLVALRAPATSPRLRRIERSVGHLREARPLRLVDAFAARATPAQIRALARRTDVAHVEDDAAAVPFGVTAQTSFGVSRAREDIPDLDGRGRVAAIIDSGVDTTMPDLAGTKVIGFKDFINGRTTPYDDLGHGSLVSDILAGTGATGAEGRGVAPGASLVGVKVVDSEAQSSLGLIAQGIQWVVENRATYGIDAINLSIGDPAGCGDGTDVASRAVDAAVAAGIVVVTAAGNAGPALCTVKSPAAAESALTVGAMADTGAGGFSEAWFSSRGPTADGRIKPDITAPGVDVAIAASGGGMTLGSGTSAAAPFVTGTALLMLQANPSLKPAGIKDLMERTAIDWGPPGRDNEYGSGRLDAYAALKAAGAPLAVPPSVPSHRAWTSSLTAGQSASYDVDVADARFPLAATLNAPGPGFGLTLHDASGSEVGTMTSQPVPSRQGDITVKTPAPGRYKATVSARTDSGDYALDVSGSLSPADTIAPALTLDAVTPSSLAGVAGSALGDFPGVVVRVLRDGALVRRIGTAPVLGRWSVPISLPEGMYTVEAEQGDASGNAARTPARALVVDTTAPAPPAVDVSVHGSTIAFSGTAESGATIEIREGGDLRATVVAGGDGAWTRDVAGVADGEHAYAVTAIDAAGNVSSATTRSVQVDAEAPSVAIDAGPPGLIATRTATLEFSSSEIGATFECRLSGGFVPCRSPQVYGDLADGAYTFRVRVIDAAGNVSATEAMRAFTVDGTAPTVTITGEPDAFAFHASEANAALVCRLDDGPWGACASAYTGLPAGSHALEVSATDAAGNTGPIAGRQWTVAAPVTPPALAATPVPPVMRPAPVLSLAVARQRLSTVLKRGLAVRVGCTGTCRTSLVLSRGKKLVARRTLTVSGTAAAKLTLSAATRRSLKRARRVTLSLEATAAGARSASSRITLIGRPAGGATGVVESASTAAG